MPLSGDKATEAFMQLEQSEVVGEDRGSQCQAGQTVPPFVATARALNELREARVRRSCLCRAWPGAQP